MARRLPSPDLHPLRWWNGRAALLIDAWDCTLTVGDLPPLRHGSLSLAAMVNSGRAAAPPMLPLMGALGRRYGFGQYVLGWIVTNRVVGELYRVLFGEPVVARGDPAGATP